jgi:hypothetical protein
MSIMVHQVVAFGNVAFVTGTQIATKLGTFVLAPYSGRLLGIHWECSLKLAT